MSTSKTFKIGEYAVGGKIQVELVGADIYIKVRDWNTNRVIKDNYFRFHHKSKVQLWLEDEVTTAFYADKIVEWIYNN